MATFTGTGSNNSNYTGTLTVSEQSYSVANNTSVVSYSLVLTGNSGYYFQQYYLTTKISINGTTVQDRDEQISMPAPSGGTSTYTVCSGTVTVPHNNDGTKTITVWATMSTPSSQAFLPGSINMPSGLNGTLALTTIPRASTMTVPSFTIGSAGTFTVTAASSSFTHTITYEFKGLTGTAATLSAGASTASWTPPNTFYAELPNSTSGTVSYVLHTFSSSTEIGSKSYSGTVKVGTSIKPTSPSITLSPVNSNTWINSQSLYVGGYTKLRIRSSATAGTGATMESYTISGPSQVSGLSGADVTSSKTLSAGAKTITVTAADSRGRTTSASQNVTFLEYSYPALTTFKAVRGTYSNGSWTTSETGDHIRVQAVGSVSLSSQGNTGTKTVKIGTTNPSATSGNYYYFTSTNANTAYKVTGTITDLVGNTTTRGLTVPTIKVPLNVNVDLPGVGIGMVAQNANLAEVAPDWSLVANGKDNKMNYLPYTWGAVGTSGSTGYARIATVSISGTYASAPITFEVSRRGDYRSVRLFLAFSSSSSTDPTLASFKYESTSGTTNFAAFVYKTTTSTWDVYVQKREASDNIGVWAYVPPYMQSRVAVTYANALLSSVPSQATSATAL